MLFEGAMPEVRLLRSTPPLGAEPAAAKEGKKHLRAVLRVSGFYHVLGLQLALSIHTRAIGVTSRGHHPFARAPLPSPAPSLSFLGRVWHGF